MTQEEITALAREYAEEIYPHEEGEDLGQMEFLRSSAEKHIEASIKMLSRRFCIVEKSKVAEEYKRAIETNRNGKETGAYSLCTMGSARKVLLESLFPEIGKEVKS